MSRCIRCIVRGRVQGVWFRASTQQQAQQLAIRGWAKNLPDGAVEVAACGEGDALERLREWLWQGPELAQVSEVVCEPFEMQSPHGFTTA
jgi:acylphosphatase